MKIAQKRNAVLEQKFWFRDDIQNKGNKSYSLMSVNEIINGKEVRLKIFFLNENLINCNFLKLIVLCINYLQGFPGLIPLVQNYLNSMDVDADSQCTLQQYLSLLSRRATGEVYTAAKWMREFVTEHPSYKKDSVISDEINYDLLRRIGRLPHDTCVKLLGNIDPTRSKTKDDVPDILTN